ncbi:MAG: minor capsid protein [Candidatus Pacearchaeota archaeon]
MIAEELALYLASLNHGTKNTDLFLNFQPASPSDCITVYDTSAPVIEESNALSVDQFGVQIIVRNVINTEARNKIMSIHKSLAGFGGESFIDNGAMVNAVFVASAPYNIGMDDKGRSEWTAHYYLRVASTGDLFRN